MVKWVHWGLFFSNYEEGSINVTMGKSSLFTIRSLPEEERPRERLARFGEGALSVQELLQVLLGRGIAGESVAVTAQKLLSQFGNIQNLAAASIEELRAVRGIGLAKATQIKAAFELSYRLLEQPLPPKGKELTSPQSVFRLVQSRLKDYRKEHFYIIPVNARNNSIAEISVGTLNSGATHPRDVFGEAVKRNAAAVILAHNHPSGDVTPSEEDLSVTKRLVEAGKIMGIEVLDHVIVAKSGYFSFRDSKLL